MYIYRERVLGNLKFRVKRKMPRTEINKSGGARNLKAFTAF